MQLYARVAKRYYDRKRLLLSDMADPAAGGSILEHLIRSPALGARDVLGLACDALMAGVDTVSHI